MESFGADWLALREPADHEARADALVADITRRLTDGASARAVDLAAGTGSNVRYLLPRLPFISHWTLIDHDQAHLATARATLDPLARRFGVTIETIAADLRDLDALPLDGCTLVTASALLDLVSAPWLDSLALHCRRANAGVLFALSYDGRIECEPADPWDALVRELVNAHQRTDKGFGPALGPDAIAAAEAAFSDRPTVTAPSDWRLDERHVSLQRELLMGWAGAAQALAPDHASALDDWLKRRLAMLEQGRSRLRVGHQDFAVQDHARSPSI